MAKKNRYMKPALKSSEAILKIVQDKIKECYASARYSLAQARDKNVYGRDGHAADAVVDLGVARNLEDLLVEFY